MLMGRLKTHTEYFYGKYPQYQDKVVCLNLSMSGESDEYIAYIKRLAWNSTNSAAIVAMDGRYSAALVIETLCCDEAVMAINKINAPHRALARR